MHLKIIWTLILLFGSTVPLYFMFNKSQSAWKAQLLVHECVIDDSLDYEISSDKNKFSVYNISQEEPRLSSGRNIFFLETSCFDKIGTSNLNCRQACAVESAARANPNMSVNLLFLNTIFPSKSTKEFIILLRKYYENIKFIHISIDEYIKNSPIEKWYKSGVIKTSQWPVSHISDILRYFTLWKFGGIYMDLDVVVITSLEKLKNFVAAEDSTTVASNILGFSLDSIGRHIASTCLYNLMYNFNGQVWANNGPGVITRTLQQFCKTNYTEEMTADRCSSFNVFPTEVFNPIPWQNWELYFDEEQAEQAMIKIERARAIHVWNKLSAANRLHRGSRAPYALIARNNCPRVYESCQSDF